MPLLIIAAIVIAFLAIAFALQNNTLVEVHLLVQQFQFSLALLLLSTLAIGVVIGLLVLLPSLIKRGWRIARAQKQTAALEAQLQERDHLLSNRDHNTDTLRQSHQNLLQALGLIDQNTSLISSKVLAQTLSALIQQMKLQPGNAKFDSIGLLIVEAHRKEPLGEVSTTERQDKLLDEAIATTIRQNVTVDTWLYCNSTAPEGAEFLCVLTGKDKSGLRQYGETLQTVLTEEPLTLADESVVAVSVRVGGAIADRNHPTHQEQIIIDKARQALAETGKRQLTSLIGNHDIKIIQVTDG
ncbi:lipopolysaccharide assembly LapA domain-containing protein [cf. Phormidesmis sp. LEGE 11477]|uniref:LapA family protein n=1 Tax=cf. Phormidesmis sp. LEGE 11477 TaxID=1828680 RepID=UPI0018809CA1|nr:LapA family protein [cf. Phormidesmis sp. LEGE 11477]MBE9061290.1 LapA family protein [cf. Phormidesmis sp. LEGE 11477]